MWTKSIPLLWTQCKPLRIIYLARTEGRNRLFGEGWPKDTRTRLFSFNALFVFWDNSSLLFGQLIVFLHFVQPGPLCFYQHIQHLCFVLNWNSIPVWSSGPLLDWHCQSSFTLNPFWDYCLLKLCRQSFVALWVCLSGWWHHKWRPPSFYESFLLKAQFTVRSHLSLKLSSTQVGNSQTIVKSKGFEDWQE